MDEEVNSDLVFLYNIVDEFKFFYEVPVILLTNKDYGEDVFKVYCDLRLARLQNKSKEKVMDIIVNFHLQWLEAIDDIENFRKLCDTCTPEEICQYIIFTVNVNNQRQKKLKSYLANLQFKNDCEQELNTELEILTNMNVEVNHELTEIEKCFSKFSDKREFQLKLIDEINNLFNWIDKLYDHIANQCDDNFKTNILQQLIKPLSYIVFEIKKSSDNKTTDETNLKKEIREMLQSPISINLQKKVIFNILDAVELVIREFEAENPTAATPFVNKKNYLINKLKKIASSNLAGILKQSIDDPKMFEDCKSYEARIFNHCLPLTGRERLVTQLCSLWDKCLNVQGRLKSTISILSATSEKQKYTDENGEFYVDSYGRKIYEQGLKLFQQNDENKLVPLTDDEQHIFFYDECGRYFIDNITNERIYKANETASEYIMGPSGSLLKVKEVCDNVTFYYDSYGRYYINEEGKHIYKDYESNIEYEQDGFGNLVRIRSQSDFFDMCPGDSNVTDDSKYLKQAVGRALCESIKNVIIDQPNDPIKYLSTQLKKYRANEEIRQRRSKEREELLLAREYKATECVSEDALGIQGLLDGISESSYNDTNLLNYNSIEIGEATPANTK